MKSIRTRDYWAIGASILILTVIGIRLAIALAAFNPATQPTGYIAQMEPSNFNLTSGNETIFRPEYDKEFYSGNLYAYRIDSAGNYNLAAELWTGGAAAHIDAQNYDTGRYIATMKDSGVGVGAGVAFRYASLSATQQGYLVSADVLDYLRGQRTNEVQNGGSFHQRGSALGDIVHSRPYYVSAGTDSTIFVGANDGMLHAIDANQSTGGNERWAYVPSMLLSKMKNLAILPFVRDYYVDGQINVATILSGTKRVLVGGLGAGGKGLYALNITGNAGLTASSEADVASKVLWEITPTTVNYAAPTGDGGATGFANLGYTYGTPVITKVAGTDAVIVGNGYNNGGDYGAYLYVISANTGQRIKGIKAGTNGTLASPNGLFNPVAVDTNSDGSADLVYAGDLYGTLWKFTLATDTATSLYESGQAITSTPAVSTHPNGGYMINFATGAMFTTTDTTDTTVHYAYGIWDGAAGSNIVTQTLTERVFGATRVRNITTNAMNWASDKGWKVALPAGERVVGEGSYVANQRFYFTAHNPTVSTLVTGTSTTVYGANWLMELDFLSGGNKNLPFLDLSADLLLNDSDRILYIASDTYIATDVYTAYDDAPPPGKAIGDVIVPALVGTPVATGRVGRPILHSVGIPVGKYLDIGVMSQPILVQLVTLNDTLFNQSPDVSFPVITELTAGGRGVAGGHFDYDIYYNGTATTTGGTKATATITVGTTGQTSGIPATLGIISVDGVTVFPALTITDISDGVSTTTNANTMKTKVTGGFTATVSGSTITITAPSVGTFYNGKTFAIVAGTSQAIAAGTPAVSKIIIGAQAAGQNTRIENVTFGGTSILSSTVTFASGSSISSIASALSAALSTPSGFTKTITTTNVADDTVTFTATTNGGTAQGIVVTSTAAAAVPAAPAVTAVRPTGFIRWSGGTTKNSSTPRINDSISSQSIKLGSTNVHPNDIDPGTSKTPAQVASSVVSAVGTGGTVKAYIGGNAITPLCAAEPVTTVCLVDTSTYANGSSIQVGSLSNFDTVTYTTSATAGGTAGSPASAGSPAYDVQATTVNSVAGTPSTGWTDFKPALTAVAFSGGVDGTTTVTAGTACTSGCASKNHVHEYDDKYDRTGVNFLDGSAGVHDLTQAIGVNSTAQFKVLIQNQYLSPAVQLHIGDPSYVYNVDQGYIPAKTYTTSSTLDLASLPTYTLSTIGSLAVNMPIDAFDAKDWWNGYLGLPSDVRVGLHPTQTGCVKAAKNATDGNMFQPVNPPATVTASGNGTPGYSATTTPDTATGVRHNGAFTLQVISASTDNSEIELSVAGRPEYGWRLKSTAYHSRLLAEWTLFWHHDNGLCYGATGWTKIPDRDMRPCGAADTTTPAPGTQKCVAAAAVNLGTDPKIENFGTGCTTTYSSTGNVETRSTTCDDGKTQIITKTRNADGTVTIRIQYTPPTIPNGTDPATASDTTQIIAADGGKTTSGGDEKGLQPRTGRISWRELIRP